MYSTRFFQKLKLLIRSRWVRSRNCGCLVTWFCYQLIAKPGNKTAAVPWPDPDRFLSNIPSSLVCYSYQVWYIQSQSEWPGTGNDLASVTYQMHRNGQIRTSAADIVVSLSTLQAIYLLWLPKKNRYLGINSKESFRELDYLSLK